MNNRGSLIYALLIILVLSGLSATILLSSVNENSIVKREANSSAALWAAEAGVQKSLWEYNYNNCTDMVQKGTNIACISCSSCSANATLAGTLAGYGDYDITLNTATATVQSVGSIPSRSSSQKIQRNVQVTVSRPEVFGNGIYAQGQVTLDDNALVNSFNSGNGPYGGANILNNGNVGTNGTGAGIVTIKDNATVDGNVSTGPSGTVSAGSNVTITGTTTHNDSVALPAVVVPASLTGLSGSGTLSVANNQSTTLNAGSYKYTGISLANNSTLTINGNVRLYLTGATALSTGNNAAITVSNGASLTVYVDGMLSTGNNVTINAVSQLASQLQIYSTYTGANGVSFSNNGTAYAAVYAPQTDVTMSNNYGFYGAVVGKTVTLVNNGEIHYDQALTSVANPFENAITSNWQEY